MQFKRLRLSGFKSFLEPTDLLIEPGLTAIVGPNGCGKSNLLEALRWVMGENRVKSLRGAGMDDVIFAGTDQRSARNMAEVVLVIDNHDRTAPINIVDAEELEVVRRIERDSGSAYRINGQDVRAKDVTLLFADMATGAHSPALVSQGRIGELIAAKPENRRQVLEEAAGISGLHARRKEAESRLKSAEGNLNRLQDVMQTMSSQMSALKRQARQALRYREISTDIEHTEAALMVRRWREAADQVMTLESDQREAARTVAERTAQSSEASRQQAEVSAALAPLRDRVVDTRAALQKVKLERESVLAEQERRIAATQKLQNQQQQIAADITREQSQLAEAEESLSVVRAERQRLMDDAANATASEEEAKAALTTAQTHAGAAEADFDALSQQAAEARARRSSLASDLLMVARRRDHFTSEIQRSQGEINALIAAGSKAAEIADTQQALTHAEDAVAVGRDGLAAQGTAMEAAVAARDEAGVQKAALDAEQASLTAELSALQARLHTPEGAVQPITDIMTAEPGFEHALAAALGGAGGAGTNPGTDAYWQRLDPLAAPKWPTGVVGLDQHVRVPEDLSRIVLATGLVVRGAADTLRGPDGDSDSDTAMLAAGLEQGCQLVTADGDLYRWDGFVRRAGGGSAAAARLKDQNRRDSVEAALQALRARVKDAEDMLAARQDACAALKADIETQQTALSAAERDVADHRRALIALEEAESRHQAAQQRLQDRIDSLQKDLDAAVLAVGDVEAQIADLPPEDGLDAALAEARSHVEDRRRCLAEARATYDGLDRARAERQSRLRMLDSNDSAWTARVNASNTQLQALAERIKTTEEELGALARDPADDAAVLNRLMDVIDARTQDASVAQEALAASEGQAQDAESALRDAAERLAQAREVAARAEAALEAGAQRRKDIAAQIGERFGCAPTAVLEKLGMDPGADLPSPLVLEPKLEQLKQERERMGAVNLRADEELVDVEEQLTHLADEKSDLEQAILRLRKGISDLNREGRERLLKAFDAVNSFFGELFVSLFGGGEAHLKLSESDDPLSAGLEIYASPPGKKLQSLSLLSGGEQALTALSLIFAVFMTNPAPVCVLDEVDAPLDDANVDRFCDLLDTMRAKTKTRFLIVTHNAVTMARMDRLFGVTMAERGISTLVSVDLERAVRMID